MSKLYSLWINMSINNGLTEGELSVRDASCAWGKFYGSSKDEEISAETISSITIPPGGIHSIKACGRDSALSGTEGTFKLFHGDILVCTVYWDCPWSSSKNIFTVEHNNTNYIVQNSSGNLDGGAIGDVTIEIIKR